MKLKELYNIAKNELIDSGEAQILCEEFLGFGRGQIISYPDKEINDCEKFLNAVERRKLGEPLQYILGHWEFDGMELYLEDGVLIPREDTLVLTQESARFIKDKKLKGVDLCSGTGAVALSIVKNCPSAFVYALELYRIPLKCLNINSMKYGCNRVKVYKGDVFESHQQFRDLDFIVSNPPYIISSEISSLQKEVQKEPHTALDGGVDGYDFYRHIINCWHHSLKIGGFIAFEIGEEQAQGVCELLINKNYSHIKVLKDINGFDRVVSAIKK